ncbi:MAG: phosphosulfolactate synthase [Acidimicrobiales bacterium]
MMQSTLQLPQRQPKPRSRGITMVIDGGLASAHFEDVVTSHGEIIDYVKFGWGTALVSSGIKRKIEVLNAHGVAFFFGGTLFEKHVLQDRFDAFLDLLRSSGCRHVEVSNGTIDLSNAEKANYIQKLAGEFTVLSEVGFKDPDRSERLAPSSWIAYIEEDLAAGASLTILESRESATSGICRPDGELRYGLIEELLGCGLDPNRLLFEAPTTRLQTHLIKRVGPEVNLGNVGPSDIVPLETLRLGLRADTLTHFERGGNENRA